MSASTLPELPEDLRAVAAKELNESPETKAAGLAELHQLLADSKGPALHRTDDGYLLMFLRHAKFNAKKALARMQALEKWMATNAQHLGDWRQYRAEDFRQLYSVGFMKAAGKAKDGALVMMMFPLRLKPGDLPDPSILLRWALWTMHRAVHNPYAQVVGQLIIETFEGVSLIQAMQFGKNIIPQAIMKQQMAFMSQCAPFRLRGIWLFHQGAVVTILMGFVRAFMSRKMRERICAFGSDFTKLHELVDPSRLPADFGGTSTDDGWAWFEAMVEAEKKELEQSRGQVEVSPAEQNLLA